MTGIDARRTLGDLFGPARDQGARPTCLAFAASDLHAGVRESWEPLSCEFLFYHAQCRAGRPPTMGATLSATLDALRHDGQPREEGWPYQPSVDAASWQPPAAVGEIHRRTGEERRNTVDEIVAMLDRGRPVLALLHLSASFDMAGPGGLVNPPADEWPDVARRHAVVVIGHGAYGAQRAVLVRNSWGSGWGMSGHAWLTENFLRPRMFGIAVLEEKAGVTLPAAST